MSRAAPGLTRKIWIDTDIALGAKRGDVDDGYAVAAILAALQAAGAVGASEAQLLGLSTVAGNTDTDTAANCARRLLEFAPYSAAEVTAQSQAAEAMAALPDGASILAIGPLTNLAGALRIDPSLLGRTQVRIVATVLNQRRHPILSRFCLNVAHDKAAAQLVFDAARDLQPLPANEPPGGLRVIPLDSALRLRAGKAELAQLSHCGPLGDYLSRHSVRWLKHSWWRYQSFSFPVWDLLAAMDALGLVSGARTDGRTLIDFDPEATWRAFIDLIAPRPE